jgi:hypothetical protein
VGRALYYQATLTGRIGAVDCEGIADVLDVVCRADQALDITVIDIKASRRNSVSFCLQVAFYARLLKDALARAAVPVASVRGAILAHGEAGATAALEPFDLALFEDDVERLLTTPDADILRKPRHDILYASASLSGLALPEDNPRLAGPIFCPTLGLCTTSCSVSHQRRHHMSASS